MFKSMNETMKEVIKSADGLVGSYISQNLYPNSKIRIITQFLNDEGKVEAYFTISNGHYEDNLRELIDVNDLFD